MDVKSILNQLPESLPEFNLTYYYTAILEGYNYFHYTNKGLYGVIRPVKKPIRTTDGYSMHMDHEEVRSMACGEDEWKIYFQGDYVLQ